MNMPSLSPIYIAGLPRSGTTWFASIVNTAKNVKYYYEPFNKDHVPEAKSHWNKYLRLDDHDEAFLEFCEDIFSNQINQASVLKNLKKPYSLLHGGLRKLPGRVMVKDVHSCVSLEWIYKQFNPTIVILMRHPCAMAASWYRTFKPTFESGNINGLERLVEQKNLIDDYLYPYEHFLKTKGSFWQKLGHYWGAAHHVMLKQQQQHPNWIVVQHEDLCLDPSGGFREIFSKLQLKWTNTTVKRLQSSTTTDSGKSYVPSRITSQESEKWKEQLTPWQVEQVLDAVEPFGIPYYID
jgi:hypothetical protein